MRTDGPDLMLAMMKIVSAHQDMFSGEEIELLSDVMFYLWHSGRTEEEIGARAGPYASDHIYERDGRWFFVDQLGDSHGPYYTQERAFTKLNEGGK